MDKYLIIYRVDILIEHIYLVLKDTKNLSIKELKENSLLLRATCFSLSQIGEMMNQLEKYLGQKYFNLPWINARRMRNVIAHDYGREDVEQIYSTIHNDLFNLKKAFEAVKNDLEFNTLVTNRLILRKLSLSDAEGIYKNWASDPEVAKYVTWYAHKDINITKALVNTWIKEEDNPKTIRYMITIKGNDEVIGCIDVVDYIDGCPEIGYCLSRSQWNKGYMSEACNAFIEYLFSIGFDSIVIEADENNIASNKVIEKLGFTFTHKETKPCSKFKPEIITVNWYKKSKI